MLAIGRVVRLATRLTARWTLIRMTSVRCSVMAFGRQTTWLRAPRRPSLLLATACHLDTGVTTTTFDGASLRTRIALAQMTQRCAFVLVAGERLAADLVAWWTILIAALTTICSV